MAAPTVSYADLLNAAHNGGVGFSFKGATITAKTQTATTPTGCAVWRVTVTRQGNVWTVDYLTQADGTVGRIIAAVDSNGVRWRLADGGGWRAG